MKKIFILDCALQEDTDPDSQNRFAIPATAQFWQVDAFSLSSGLARLLYLYDEGDELLRFIRLRFFRENLDNTVDFSTFRGRFEHFGQLFWGFETSVNSLAYDDIPILVPVAIALAASKEKR
jgi:hypothetical protein